MNKSQLRGLSVAVLVVAGATSLFWAMAADAPLPGETWETTSQPMIEGMPPGMQMPVSRLSRCVAKNSAGPPVATNPQQSCTNSNYQSTGLKVSWAVSCTGPTSTGVGEIVYAPDKKSFTGMIKFMSAKGNMTINLTGNKGADCPNPK